MINLEPSVINVIEFIVVMELWSRLSNLCGDGLNWFTSQNTLQLMGLQNKLENRYTQNSTDMRANDENPEPVVIPKTTQNNK